MTMLISPIRIRLKLFALGCALSALTTPPCFAEDPKLCVFDLLGTAGDMFNASKDYALAMQSAGFGVTLKAYVDERVAIEDFKAGQCDAVLATSFRTRAFNRSRRRPMLSVPH